MRRSGKLSHMRLAVLLLWILGVLLAAGLSAAETLKVERDSMQLYRDPNFASPSLGVVPSGSEVTVMSRSGDWVQVTYQGKSGWMHKTAFPQAAGPAAGMPGFLSRGPVQETKSDEVALAGKGFTPEVEASYRQKNPSLNYAQVDQIESYRVDGAQLAAFLREGGLTP